MIFFMTLVFYLLYLLPDCCILYACGACYMTLVCLSLKAGLELNESIK